MIIRFSVANHRSFFDRQELSLVASGAIKDGGLTIACPSVPSGEVLPVALVYGPNASGKSNLIRAIEFLSQAVANSHLQRGPDVLVPRSAFRLRKEASESPSHFELEFLFEQQHYVYGFEASDRAFTSEWLYTYPNNRRAILFERAGADGPYTFGRTLRGQNKIIEGLTRPNSLFLSACMQNNHEALTSLATFIANLNIETEVTVGSAAVNLHYSEKDPDPRSIEFLKLCNAGIVSFTKEDVAQTETAQKLSSAIVSAMRSVLPDIPEDFSMPLTPTREVRLGHDRSDGEVTYFDLAMESAGTRRLLVLLDKVFNCLDGGKALFVDELDASLHTQIAAEVLSLFTNPRINKRGAQLVATTHDTNLLREPSLRRDEVWFVEKLADGQSMLFPLTDVRTRKGDNLERGYLEGRYGAVPITHSIERLLTNED
jgi:AAA15 family ATPase/GTPase